MKKPYIIFFSIYGIFHLGLVIMTFYAHNLYAKNKLTDLLSLAKQIPTTRWLALIGLLIFILNVSFFIIQQKRLESKIAEAESEKNAYKAKMYDMQNTSEVTTSTDAGTESSAS